MDSTLLVATAAQKAITGEVEWGSHGGFLLDKALLSLRLMYLILKEPSPKDVI